MRRRDFLASVVALAATNATEYAHGFPYWETEAFPSTNPPDLSVALSKRFVALTSWMQQVGWLVYLRRISGVVQLDNQPSLTGNELFLLEPFSQLQLAAIRNEPGFEDFGGDRFITPGKPALSLLYFALASPRVKLRSADSVFDDENYPTLEQIDGLEDCIHSKVGFDLAKIDKDFVLAVFAYEFRPAAKTPHKAYADMVYSRTGISRVGSSSMVWSRLHRCHINKPIAARNYQDAAVVPARYALFLAKKVPYCDGGVEQFTRIGIPSSERDYCFLLPLRKIVNGDPLWDGRNVFFSEAHRDEKLAQLFRMKPHSDQRLKAPVSFRLDEAPFTRVSCSSTDPAQSSGCTTEAQAFVKLTSKGSSVLLSSIEAPLVSTITQVVAGKSELARFIVPKAHGKAFGNRRYTSLKLVERPYREALGLGRADDIPSSGSRTIYDSPKNGPEFVNIRHQVIEDEIRPLGPGVEKWTKLLNEGGYEAALFRDNLCDGCVHAALSQRMGTSGGEIGGKADWIASLPILPAFSIVSAPDFFSQVDPVDLDVGGLTDDYVEGGTEIVSGTRVRANPHLHLPGSDGIAFPYNNGTQTVENEVTLTVTAVISEVAIGKNPQCTSIFKPENPWSHDYVSTNTLPDASSNVFAPGWDITYSDVSAGDGGSSKEKHETFYFASFGLGSPFPEDMKLCAAANGMWAALSPDAARTFFAGLEAVPTNLIGIKKRRPTAMMPLLDSEIGQNAHSPVRDDGGAETWGWDGEQGPYLHVNMTDGMRKLEVNYTDIGKADYVENALNSRMDLRTLQAMSLSESLDRMRALRACISALPGDRHPRRSKLWLISAEKVDWRDGARGVGIPKAFYPSGKEWATKSHFTDSSQGEGYLYLFAEIAEGTQREAEPNTSSKRMAVDCSNLYVCQVLKRQSAPETAVKAWRVAWLPITASSTSGDAEHWRFA